MATYPGTDFDDDIYASSYSDVIYGYDGDDLIFAYGGHDDVYGGYDHDTIYGSDGDDYLSGQAGNDYLSGGNDHDDLYGGSGHDDLHGGAGLDYLSGSTGDDLLSGGTGRDTQSGGSGEDTFLFKRGDSGLTTSTVDTITDWNRYDDWIDTAVKGTSTNYREHNTFATSIAAAVDDAEDLYPSTSIKHVFLYNTSTDTGYLVSDLNSDGAFDTGVVLRNAGLASDMNYLYLI